MNTASRREVIFVHSSDLHLGDDSSTERRLAPLCRVTATAAAVRADFLILAGDTFDSNRQTSQLLEDAACIMEGFKAPIVILPGNHDPLTLDSVYRRDEIAAIPNVYVLGLTQDSVVVFPELELEIWGRAHLDYDDMSPLCTPHPHATRRQIAVAHGHFVDKPVKSGRLFGSWLIRRENLREASCDYIALGHWIHAERVGGNKVNAYYSGSPDDAGTVNVVRLRGDSSVEVTVVDIPY